MKAREHDSVRTASPDHEILRDPAFWAWVAVAVLAILPASAALAGG